VYNFSRFSDRSRCIFIAMEFGAEKNQAGMFCLKYPDVNPVKKNRLK